MKQSTILAMCIASITLSCSKGSKSDNAPTVDVEKVENSLDEAATRDADLAAKQKEIDELKAKLETNIEEIEKLRSSEDNNAARINVLEEDSAALTEEIDVLEKEKTELLAKITRLDLEKADLLKQVEKKEDELKTAMLSVNQLKSEIKGLEKSLEEARENSAASPSELRAKVDELESALDKKLAELEEANKLASDLKRSVTELTKKNKELKFLSVQQFLYGLRENRLFIADNNDLSDRFDIKSGETCASILSFDDETTLRDVAGVPAGYKLGYKRMLICQEGSDNPELMVETGILTNFINDDRIQVVALVAEEQSCATEGEVPVFGGWQQAFKPYEYEVAGYESIDLWTGPRVEHNMAGTLPNVFAESCSAVIANNSGAKLVHLACQTALGLTPSSPVDQGCFFETKQDDNNKFELSFERN